MKSTERNINHSGKYTSSSAEVFTCLESEINKTNKISAEIKPCLQRANRYCYGHKKLMTGRKIK